jgi:hypothetical protein
LRGNHSRQSRRASLCIKRRSSRGHRIAISPRRLALTAHGDDLARLAATVADELELSAEVIDLLSPLGTNGGRRPWSIGQMTLERAAQA